MKKYWKQLEAWVTGSRRDIFRAARIKLTFLYVLVLACVIALFSLALFFILSQEIRDNIHDKIREDQDEHQIISATIDGLQTGIALIDLTLLGISGFLGYFLAGKTLRPIEETLKRQKQFTSDASHELRTPLAIMKTETEVALKNPNLSTTEMREVMTSNVEEIDRISFMVNELLQLSREEVVSNGTLEEVDVVPILKQAIKRASSLTSEQRFLIKGLDQPIKIMGSANSLERAFLNVLQNAIAYSNKGDKIFIEANRVNGEVVIKISDSGKGISKEDLPHIFKRFYKADKARGQKSETGAGLGLAIVDEIIKNHGGTVTIESELDRGTIVTFKIPAL
jgi:signal transduction histidine kinase